MAPRPLIVLVGQTAVGKSEMAIKLAETFNGEIICADSRTVYKGMDIGTAKPSKDDMRRVKHYLIDEITPDKKFSASDMKKLANKAIEDIISKNKTPFLVGGTGLYINALVYDFKFGAVNEKLRSELEDLAIEDLQKKAEEIGINSSDIDFLNRRHLARAIERGNVPKDDNKIRKNCLMLGIDINQDELKKRIKARIEKMIQNGLENEVRTLAGKYGFDAPGMDAICYKEWQTFFKNEQSLDELKQKLYKDNWQYAKRQKTWFKKDTNIQWITSVDEASVLVQQFLIQ